MIREQKVTRYRPVCDKCGWEGGSVYRKSFAERELSNHKCGEHREVYSSDGGYRGILGGFTRRCVCGGRYISDTLDAFVCPTLDIRR